MMEYFAKIKKEKDGGYLAEFPALPGCLTEGRTLAEAMKNAKEALNGWLAAHCDRNLPIPTPKKRMSKSFYPIEVDVQIEFAIRLRQLRKQRGLSQSQVANKLGISQQAYAKLEIPGKANPSLITLQKLSDALDAELEIRFAA
ncbi:MAG: type II toxin-antitoxin system HicB family antitoxin [Deltaproteobacteria bacterium]|nr:type II toxin-antitoxin system HicB family antitoxin [Deltaproteobacteria bacterium]